MTQAQTFDPIAFKQRMRQEWNDAAVGWRRWCHVVEGKDGGQRHSAKLVELARLRPGSSVLDVGAPARHRPRGSRQPGRARARSPKPGLGRGA